MGSSASVADTDITDVPVKPKNKKDKLKGAMHSGIFEYTIDN